MKPIDDPRFAEAVRLFEQEYAIRRTANANANQAHANTFQLSGLSAKPSPQTHYRTMANLRKAVFERLDAKKD